MLLLGRLEVCAKLFAKNFAIHRFIKTDDQRAALAQSRRAQIAGAAEQHAQQRFRARLLFFQIKMNDASAFRGIDHVNVFDHCQHVLPRQRYFLRARFFDRLDLVLRKKLLRFGARVSTWAMIIPIDFGHISFSLEVPF